MAVRRAGLILAVRSLIVRRQPGVGACGRLGPNPNGRVMGTCAPVQQGGSRCSGSVAELRRVARRVPRRLRRSCEMDWDAETRLHAAPIRPLLSRRFWDRSHVPTTCATLSWSLSGFSSIFLEFNDLRGWLVEVK